MIRNFLNKIFSSKIFYVIFSVLVAFSLWLFVEINENQEDRVTLELPVYVVGEDILRDRDLFISAINPEYVAISFEASRSAIAELRRGPLVAQIDVSRITSSGVTSVEHEIIFPENFDEGQINGQFASINRITLTIDRLTSKQVLVEAPYLGGTVSDELVVEPTIIDPAVITVYGPEDILSRIGVAYVPILRENISSTYIDDLPFIILDEYGYELEPELHEQLQFNVETVRVTVPVKMIREIPLDVEFFHGAGSSAENIDFYIDPMSIILTGDPDAFYDLNVITLGTIDTTRFGLRTLEPFVFNIIHPSNLENVSGVIQANVFVEVIGLETDSYSVANINAVNIPHGYEVDILNEIMVVRVRGTREDLDYLAESMNAGGLNIRVEVDLEGLDAGTHRVFPPNVRIFIDGIDREIGWVGAIAEYIVTVRLLPISELE